ncbi:hypothetical protein [Homoserinimonas sp. A520]
MWHGRGGLAALIVAGGVLVFAAVQQLVGAASSTLIGIGLNSIPPMYWESIWGGAITGIFSYHLPFALGVFASLWLVAPISAGLSLSRVVVRALVASGIGAVLALVVRVAWDAVWALQGVGPWFGHAFPALPHERLGHSLMFGVQAGIGAFTLHLAMVVLGCVLLWIWPARHPSPHAVSADTTSV